MTRIANFSAGPAAMPVEALLEAQRSLLDFAGTGMSVMEQSHRDKPYEAVHEEALALVKRLLGLGADHEVLFLQGGASQQFAMVPLSFLGPGKRGDYIVTGAWGEKALDEASLVAKLAGGEVRDVSPGPRERGYVDLPDTGEVGDCAGAAYVHLTTNETIHGVQWGASAASPIPSVAAPLVCDVSSDFLGREMDFSRVAFAYAGAQKNVGPSGVTVVVVAREMLARARTDLPKIFTYAEHAKAGSMLNTPPTFAIYLVREVLAQLERTGGVPAQAARNREKAAAVYAAIDRASGFYRAPVAGEARSLMNVVFRLPTEALEKELVAASKAAGLVGLKGHRSVGGIRVSLYNAVTLEWVATLTDFMDEFARTKG